MEAQWFGWLPSIAYPSVDPAEGWWYPQTSTINWCEEDYYATPMIAEFINTLTNLLFMWLGVKGIRNCLAQGWDRVYLVSFLGYLTVGTGSFLFHASLKYPMQLVDELSMIYTTCIMVYAVFSFTQSLLFRQLLAGGLISLCAFITAYYHYLQDPTFHQNAYALLTAIVVFRSMYIMEVHLRPSLQPGYGKRKEEELNETEASPSPTAAIYTNGNGHKKGNSSCQANGLTNGNGHGYYTRSKGKTYAATTGNGHNTHTTSIGDSSADEKGNGAVNGNGNGNGHINGLTNGNGPSTHSHTNGNPNSITNKFKPITPTSEARDLAILHRMWAIVTCGLVIFLSGFLLWNLDNTYCSRVRSWRHTIGLPWGVVLEGHGWWHLMTGTGAYMSLVWGIWLRECLKGNREGVVCRWLGDKEVAGERGKGKGGWRWLPEVVRVERDKTGDVGMLEGNGHLKVQ